MARTAKLLCALLLTALPAAASGAHPDCEESQRTGAVTACEGEHWEGRDPNAPDVGIAINAGPEPGKPNPGNNGPTDAVHLRASADSGAYGHVAVWGLAGAALYAGPGIVAVYAVDHTDSALAALGLVETFDEAYEAAEEANPTTPPGGPHGETSEGNVLWTLVHETHLTHDGGVGEERGCTQADYEEEHCVRDNTAVTVETRAHMLLP